MSLELRWPAIILDDPEPTDFAVDLVNVSDEVWRPGEERLQVVGVITDPGGGGFPRRVVLGRGGSPGVPLAPGEYVRMPVMIDPGAWTRTKPGDRDIRAVLVGTHGVVAPPLRVHVSAELIAAKTPLPRAERPDLAERLTFERDLRDAARAAHSELVTVAEIAAQATDRSSAIQAIAELLGLDSERARWIYETPLSQLSPAGLSEAERRVADLERRAKEA